MQQDAEAVIQFSDKLRKTLTTYMASIGDFLWDVFLAFVIFFVGVKIIKWITRKINLSLKKTNMDQGAVQFLTSMTKFVSYAALIFVIARKCGVSAASMATLIASAGVTIGLGLQGGLTNIAGGIMILLFHPFQVGDYIIADTAKGHEGTVAKMDIYYTTLISIDNRNIVIPNGVLSSKPIINVTAKDLRRLEWICGITYDSDIKKAKKVLEKLLKHHKDIRNPEDLQIFVWDLTENSVSIGFRAWIDTANYFPIKWKLNEEIKIAFDNAGIKFAYNQLDVHLKKEEDTTPDA